MKRCTQFLAGTVLALAPLGGGTALAAAAPPSGGTIAIDAKTADGADDPALPSFVDAVSETLTARGFTIFNDPDHAAYRAELTLGRAAVGTGLGKDPNRDTVGLAGTGVVVPMSTGNSSVVTLRRTQLEIRIRHREDGSLVWHGRAVTVRQTGTQAGTSRMVAAALSNALFAAYPAQPAEDIGVP